MSLKFFYKSPNWSLALSAPSTPLLFAPVTINLDTVVTDCTYAGIFGRTFKKYHINYSKDKDGDILSYSALYSLQNEPW